MKTVMITGSSSGYGLETRVFNTNTFGVEAMTQASHPNDVTGVGFKVGYDSASQFSREYCRYFGAAPSQDAQKLRSLTATLA
ncbi:hypothetical protein [Devosia submarina]|uniref:hypothetical protein n=1 Tax=Devosia submarina TaxID=1173082 RepID=UPI00147365DA|nr:hypothetical protein [Devosia submarina]